MSTKGDKGYKDKDDFCNLVIIRILGWDQWAWRRIQPNKFQRKFLKVWLSWKVVVDLDFL